MKRLFAMVAVLAVVAAATPPPAIATHDNARDADVELWIVDADGSNERRVAGGWEESRLPDPEWAPDGSRIAIVRPGPEGAGESRVVVIDLATGTETVVSDPSERVGSSVAWFPDGTRLVYIFLGEGESGLRTVTPTGTDRQTVYTAPPDIEIWDLDISPDGREVAILQPVERYGNPRLHIVDLATGTARLVSNEQGFEGTAWSPTGEWIAFDTWGGDTYVVRPDGTGGKFLEPNVFYASEVAWAPHSSEFVISALSDDSGYGVDIYRASAETGRAELIIPNASTPSWAPDGGRIAYHSVARPAEDLDVYSARLDGSDVRRLTSEDLHGDFNPLWSPDGSRLAFFRRGEFITCPDFPTGAEIIGTLGADRLKGTPGRDVIHGRGGDDEIFGLGGDDIICGGKGDDEVIGGGDRDRLYGDEGSDVLRGQRDGDVLDGGRGEDRDTLDGGHGRDAVSYGAIDDVGEGLKIDLAAGEARGHGVDVLVEIENAYGSESVDTILGTPGRNRLFGGPFGGGDFSGDVIRGRGGGDVLEGWSESDELYGGRGRDRLDGEGRARARGGKDLLNGGLGRDTCRRGERYVSCEIQRT